jgi:hypothetical protein
LRFIHELPGYRESFERVAHFDPPYLPDASKSDGARYQIGGRHYKFDLYFEPMGRTLFRQDKHSTPANVHAVPDCVMIHAIGPADREWQNDLKTSRIPSLDRLIHIRPYFLPQKGIVPST